MYRKSRALHRWIGLIASLFLIFIAFTGIMLSLKERVDWIRPFNERGAEFASLADVISVEVAAESALSAGMQHLSSVEDIGRFEFHVNRNLYKIHSRDGYDEVQICAVTGDVLRTGVRRDQMFEDWHDLSAFGQIWYDYLLPLIGVALIGLGASGIYMFFVPVFRRIQFRREQARKLRG